MLSWNKKWISSTTIKKKTANFYRKIAISAHCALSLAGHRFWHHKSIVNVGVVYNVCGKKVATYANAIYVNDWHVQSSTRLTFLPILSKDLLRYGRNTPPDLIFWKSHLGGRLRKDPRTLGMDFLDHNLLWSQKVHIKIFLMRGQTIFWAY